MKQNRVLSGIACAMLCCALFCAIAAPVTAYAEEDASAVFTAEEQALIQASMRHPISVGIITSTEPVCYVDEESGQFTGISMEILYAVCRKTGLRFEYLPIDLSKNTPVGWLKAGEFDMVAGIIKNKTFENDTELILSDGMMADSIVLIGRMGEDFTKNPSGKKIAVLEGFQVAWEYASATFPQHELVTYATFEECMDAVSKGAADATVYMRSCASYYMQNPHYDSLQMVIAYSKDVFTCSAVLSKDNSVLMSIVDKGLHMVPEGERNTIMMDYTVLNPYDTSFEDVLYEYRAALSVIAILMTAVVVICFVMMSMRGKNTRKLESAYKQTQEALQQAEEARRQAESAAEEALAVSARLRQQISLTRQWQEASETDELTGLLNRRGGEQRIRDFIAHGGKGLLCMFDIDKFKLINDRYGHDIGDKALKAVAHCMRTFRDNDVQVRFGGDEFMVCAIGVATREQALVCVEKFMDSIGKIDIPELQGNKITVSMGMVFCDGDADTSFDELYRRVDAAMYECKRDEKERYRFG